MVDRDGGVGLVLEAPRDGGHLAPCLVEGLVPNSPAANSEEISIGDIVVQVDGVPVAGLSLTEIVELLVGPLGSTVTVDFDGSLKDYSVTLTRTNIAGLYSPPTRILQKELSWASPEVESPGRHIGSFCSFQSVGSSQEMGSASELMLLRTQLAQARTDQEELQAKFDRLRQMLEVQQSLTNVSERRRDETERNGATHTPEAQDIRSNARLESIETGGNDRADTSSKAVLPGSQSPLGAAVQKKQSLEEAEAQLAAERALCRELRGKLRESNARILEHEEQEVQMRRGTEIMAAMATQAVGAAAHVEAEKIRIAQSEEGETASGAASRTRQYKKPADWRNRRSWHATETEKVTCEVAEAAAREVAEAAARELVEHRMLLGSQRGCKGEAAKATMEAMTDMLAAAAMRKRVLEAELKAPGSGSLSSPETLVRNASPLAQSEALEEQPADPCSWTPGPSDEGAATGLVAGGPERRSDCGIGEQGATMQKRNNSVVPQSREAEVSSPEQRLFNGASDSSRSIEGQPQTPSSESQDRISLEAWARARRDIKNKRQSGAFQVSPERSASFQPQLASDVENGGKQGSTDGGSPAACNGAALHAALGPAHSTVQSEAERKEGTGSDDDIDDAFFLSLTEDDDFSSWLLDPAGVGETQQLASGRLRHGPSPKRPQLFTQAI